MAKFKKGDRVRVLDTKGDDSYLVGDTLTILENNCEIPDAETLDGEKVLVRETDVELITDYQPITPKVEEELPVNRHVDVPKEYFDTLDIEIKPKMYEEWVEPTLKKTKQTAMQKLTSALKRVLSADKQTLYKAGVIGGDLELTTRGQSNYTDALFNNEGDHKKAVAQMVEDAQAYIDEEKN